MNIAIILRGCPIGTRLYSPIYGELSLVGVNLGFSYPICCRVVNSGNTMSFAKDGRCHKTDAEPTLFPSKTQRDWSKFRLSVKNGDIMMDIDGERPFIATGEMYCNILPKYICGINSSGEFRLGFYGAGWTSDFYIPASEEVKKKLFDKIKEAGYKWNAETLKLEKIEPKFKEGDIIELDNVLYLTTGIIKNDKLQTCCLMKETTINVYEPEFNKGLLNIATLATKEKRNKFYSALIRYGYEYDKNQHKLVKQEFKPFDMVLVRNDANKKWSIELFSYYDKEDKLFPYVCLDGCYHYCIPYEGNESLLGKTTNHHMK